MTTAPPFVRASQGGGKMEFKHEGSGSRGGQIAAAMTGWRSRRRPSWGATGSTAAAAAATAGGTSVRGASPSPPPPPIPSVHPTAGAGAGAGGGLLEAVLPPDTIVLVFSYLDTRTIMALTRVARAVARQARGQVRAIDSESVKVALPDEGLYGPGASSCIAWIGLYLRRPGWAWQSLFHPPPYPKYEYPQGNPHNPALAALIQALPAFPNLEALALEYRNVRCEDCLALAAAIAAGRAGGRLKSLNVSYNFLRKEGGRALGTCLRQLHDLRELVLNDNSIYYEAVAGICEALRDGACPKLERFSLAYNWVGVLGSREIGALLGSGRLRQLRFLDLRGNGITAVGLCMFLEALLLGAKAAAAAAAEASRPHHAFGGAAGGQGKEAGTASVAEASVDPYCNAASFYRRFYLHEDASGGASSSPPSTSDRAVEEGRPPPAPALLSPCPFLACIDLSFNYIAEEGAAALAEAVRMGLFPRLREIRVAQNPLDDATGGLRLREACAPGCRVVY